MAEEDKKSEKGFVRKAFGMAAKVALWSFPLAISASLVFDPTWLLIFHDTSNVMAQAWIHKITPYTEWLPYHLGLQGDGGLLHGVMSSFLSDELNAAAAVTSAVEATTAPVSVQSAVSVSIPGLDF